MRIVIEKALRRLTLLDEEMGEILRCPVGLGRCPVGPKQWEGDGKTPEGTYFVCLKKQGKHGPSLGISYPNVADAGRAGVDAALIACIRAREAAGERPPWGTTLGGEIYIHGGGATRDWTAGCIALSDADAERLYQLTPLGTAIEIRA